MKTTILIIALIIIVVFGSFLVFREQGPSLKIGNEKISLIIADTPEKREKGLGDLQELPEDSAMLFTFEKEDTYGIWMKDMKFPIDIIWLDTSKKIVTLEENVFPDTYPEIFYPGEKSFYVIEANAGFVEKNNLTTGNTLDFSI